jgi:DNA-binding CsgD family transcriptional regulator
LSTFWGKDFVQQVGSIERWKPHFVHISGQTGLSTAAIVGLPRKPGAVQGPACPPQMQAGCFSLLYDFHERQSTHSPLSCAAFRAMKKSSKPAALDVLSPRERQVLKLVVEGKTSKETAAIVGVKPSSIDTYRSRIMAKLEVTDLASLVRYAIRHGVIKA